MWTFRKCRILVVTLIYQQRISCLSKGKEAIGGSDMVKAPMTISIMFKTRILVLDGTGWKCLSLLPSLVAIMASENVPEAQSWPCLSVCYNFPKILPPQHTSCHWSTGSILCPRSPWSFPTIAPNPAALWGMPKIHIRITATVGESCF